MRRIGGTKYPTVHTPIRITNNTTAGNISDSSISWEIGKKKTMNTTM
jgi:hypothetical protein